ncbi:MAG: nucleotide sugar dehydrogenase [Candidatus Thorarchaeota archaeon]
MGNLVVVGLGYVGVPVAAKFAEVGFDVTGIDIVDDKIKNINAGISPIVGKEPGLAELVRDVVDAGNLKATNDYAVIAESEYVLIVVETPFQEDINKPYYHALRSAASSVAENLKKGTLVVIESTVAPGTTQSIVKPILENHSGMIAGEDFLLATAPERVAPGRLLHNLVNMDRVIGGINDRSTKAAARLYRHIVRGELYEVDALTAEVVKTTENTYRDVQIAFANEIALLCENIGVDVWEVRELVNKVPNREMHQPGAGVGGHCLPKDSWLLAFGARGRYEPRLIAVARDINDSMPLHMSDLCEDALNSIRGSIYGSTVTILGVAYREGTDDVRNSPALKLQKSLEALGVRIVLHDPYVKATDEMHVISDLDAAITDSDCIALTAAHQEYRDMDLNRVGELMRTRIIVDGRAIFDEGLAEEKGFSYVSVGKPFKLTK